jgi:SAM-dependent methyltransferase
MAKQNRVIGTACCICNGDVSRISLEGQGHALDKSSFGSSRTNLSVGNLVRCQLCGFGFSEVRPDEDKLGDLYRDLDTETYEAETIGRSITARRHLKILQRHRKPPGQLLDVGCASGKFLREAISAGWEAFGVEPSRALFALAEESLGGRATLLQSTLQRADFAAGSFDAIAMWDVLEHVPDPLAFLALAGSLLRAGGYLVLNVPNLDSLQARLLGRSWPLVLPEHLNYFNKSSLRLAAEKVGLQLVRLGSRPAAFSLRYIAFRLRQHGVPLANSLEALTVRCFLGKLVIPVYMGEVCAVLTKP